VKSPNDAGDLVWNWVQVRNPSRVCKGTFSRLRCVNEVNRRSGSTSVCSDPLNVWIEEHPGVRSAPLDVKRQNSPRKVVGRRTGVKPDMLPSDGLSLIGE
jgi:hypothetical protein